MTFSRKCITWMHALHQVTGSIALGEISDDDLKHWIGTLRKVLQEMEDYLDTPEHTL